MKWLIFISILLAAVISVFVLDLQHVLTLQSLKEHRMELVDLKERHPVSAVLAFIAAYVVAIVMAIPVKTILALGAGAVFGIMAGTLYTVIGASMGATALFLLARYAMKDSFRRRYGYRIEKLSANLRQKGLSYLLLLRLIPLSPFVLVTIAAAFVGLPLRTFVIGTAVGIAPVSLLFCNAGASIATISSTSEVFSPRVVISLVLLAGLALLPLIKRLFEK